MAASTVSPAALARARHRAPDDLQGLFTGTLFAALGIFLFQHAQLVPGGTVGLALLLHYASGWNVGWTLFLVNLPFYALAWLRLGPAFTAKTVASVGLLAAVAWALPLGIDLRQVAPGVAAVLGGLLCGAGMLMLFRHGASLGGINILVLHLQEKLGWPAGRVQMALDGAVVLGGGLWVGDWRTLAWSVLAVVALNLALVFNHKPGRYTAV